MYKTVKTLQYIIMNQKYILKLLCRRSKAYMFDRI